MEDSKIAVLFHLGKERPPCIKNPSDRGDQLPETDALQIASEVHLEIRRSWCKFRFDRKMQGWLFSGLIAVSPIHSFLSHQFQIILPPYMGNPEPGKP